VWIGVAEAVVCEDGEGVDITPLGVVEGVAEEVAGTTVGVDTTAVGVAVVTGSVHSGLEEDVQEVVGQPVRVQERELVQALERVQVRLLPLRRRPLLQCALRGTSVALSPPRR
jgi:hypothetical protein